MEKPSQFPAVLLTCFGICTLMYAGVAVMGYLMFGESTLSQFTLNLPEDLVATKIAVWTTVVNPFTKYALTMTPVALSLEELIPSNIGKSHVYAILIRTALVISTLVVGLSIPFFVLFDALPFSFLFDRSGDGTNWIFAYNASNLDTTLCMLPEHLEGQNYSFSDLVSCIRKDTDELCGASISLTVSEGTQNQ
ncbi:hypothetical protein RHSIM_Rhsim02G0095000 [Rhododendron simsii]|uniref:Amino acid transporter transmembrane domain-containing protein n=1 Tax=Rhododendron simsii TaxID=118357 RepID=A0A834LWV7_RHOSS|nr:hypothetical protein RHSIM_Rhsim02G0095000 [Rhododendron simsii]